MWMRTPLAFWAAGLLAGVAAPAVSAQSPGGDSVTGSAEDCSEVVDPDVCFHPTSVDLNARSGPSGENSTGTGAWERVVGSGASLGDAGTVSCLAVSGHTAIVGFSSVPGFIRTLVRVTDGGSSPGADSFAAVTQGFLGLTAPVPPPDCSSFPPGPAGDVRFDGSGVNERGDIVVVDAPPPPTTYTECRQGGWVKYGFASHAACIAYVHDLARRKCIFERAYVGIVAFRAKYGLGPNHDYAMRRCVRRYTGF
jgi:hypothetical protein